MTIDTGDDRTTTGLSYMNTASAILDATDYEFDGPHTRTSSHSERTDRRQGHVERLEGRHQKRVTATTRPDALVSAMLLIVGHLYENRQDVTPFRVYETPLASRYLMNPHRLVSFV